MAEPEVRWLGQVMVADVRDVAAAHVLALEAAGAAGQRLFCASRVIHFRELAAALARLFPRYPVAAAAPPPTAPPSGASSWSVDTQPLAALGLARYVALDDMLRDTVLSLVQAHVVPQL